jgi:phage terminase large subunit
MAGVATLPRAKVVIPYGPRPQQREVHRLRELKRFGVIVCHRRFGKTVLAVNELIKGALTCKKERPRFGYIAPTYTQGKATSFDYFKHYSSTMPGATVNQSELRVDYPNKGQVRVYGGDNPDSLRGLYFDGVVLDEYGMHAAKTYSEVVAPALVDRGGWALFMGTPNGKNQFYDIAQHAKAEESKGNPDWFFREYKASQTGLLDPSYLASAKSVMTDDEYAQEFECSFEAAVRGAIYAKELERVRVDGRLTNVPYDPALPVDTDWDLGVGDATAIIFTQSLRSGEVRIIDYHEASGEGLPYYVRILSQKGYTYGTHFAPHDIAVRELGSGKSRLEVAASFGLRFAITPRIHGQVGVEVEEGINAARLLLPRCWFDQTKAAPLIEALMHYRRDYNTRLNEFKATPVHDWSSHGADAFRGLAVRHQVPKRPREDDPYNPLPYTVGSQQTAWMS